MSNHGAVVLAAGASRRLGRPKQLVQVDGESLLRRSLRCVLATAPRDTVVVLGHAAQELAAHIADLPARCVLGAQWQQGMGHSLRQGVAQLAPGCDGVLVVLCDQPALDEAHLQALLRAWQANPRQAAATGYAQTLGVPVLLPRGWLRDAALDGDRGARDLLRARAAQVQVVENAALARDVDVPGDLADG
ncbi:nucleotidyltransferase family protein [Tahibacter harae]|uniref:Nucleotidyltransferase family protein n=1 Tax=Tahibacter harae TaxID=2963937 RepID=A0ABT1QUM0_9GAMM|nr:nucleotidyltransferase family protein [Tahibacter harae]MCQ4165963.1 nucleotidyltransferase family protein [Tahibacter harae]